MSVNLLDAVLILNYLFNNASLSSCMDAYDANDVDGVNIADPIHVLAYLFTQGAAPAPPFVACGLDPTVDDNEACIEPNQCP